MQPLVLRRFVVSARARGMPEITNHGKLFFPQKALPAGGLPAVTGPILASFIYEWHRPSRLVARRILGPKSGWRTEHLTAVDINPVTATGNGFVFVRRHDCSAPGRQTQD